MKERFVYSFNVFPASIKSINPIRKYPHIIESYACILKIIVVTDIDRLINALMSVNMFYPKTIKISNIFIMNIQINPMSSNIRILIKIYYVSPSFIFSRLSREKSPINLDSFS